MAALNIELAQELYFLIPEYIFKMRNILFLQKLNLNNNIKNVIGLENKEYYNFFRDT